MPTNLSQIITKFDALDLRERVLISIAIIAIVFMLFDVFWLTPNQNEISRLESGVAETSQQTSERINRQQEFNISLLRSRNDPKVAKLEILESKLKEVRATLTDKALNLVQPEDMAMVVKQIISSTKNLKLQRLNKFKTIELTENLEKKEEQEDGDPAIRLFRHTMEIVLEGDYSSTFKFLSRLEGMKKQVAFDSFEYAVNKYPKANITLIVSTLSLQEEWIGG